MDAERFREEVEIGNPGALMGILLGSLPKLEALVTDYTLMDQSDLPGIIIEDNLLVQSIRRIWYYLVALMLSAARVAST